jgi:hypothetical protein
LPVLDKLHLIQRYAVGVQVGCAGQARHLAKSGLQIALILDGPLKLGMFVAAEA